MEELKPLTNREIRYAMIKGMAEKKDYRKKPFFLWSLEISGLTEYFVDATLRDVARGRYFVEDITYELN